MYIKFFTSEQFDRQGFRNLLTRYNVRCAVVGDGLIINLEDFNGVPNLPAWAEVNRKSINDPLHTRPATEHEYNTARLPRYAVRSYTAGTGIELVTLFVDDDYNVIVEVAEQWHRIANRQTLVVDTATGEVLNIIY